jgi:hypothetical protein
MSVCQIETCALNLGLGNTGSMRFNWSDASFSLPVVVGGNPIANAAIGVVIIVVWRRWCWSIIGSIVDQITIGDVIFLDSILDFRGWVNVVIAWGWDLWFEVLDVLIVGDLPFVVDVHGGSSLSIQFNMSGVLHRVGHDDVVRVNSILPVGHNHVVLSSNPIVLHAKITQGGMVQ